ncbi:hypothetical protein ACET3Z_010468 [Daucus carota]
MDLFEKAKTVRLRTITDKFLVAEDDEETVFQSREDYSKNSIWKVERIRGRYVRFKSCHGTYLTASAQLFVPGIIGKKVVHQSIPETADDVWIDWEPVRDGFQVRLRSRSGSFLRPNGGLPPWRNTVTHDMPHTSKTHEKVLWNIDVVEALPTPHRRSCSDFTKAPAPHVDDHKTAASHPPHKKLTTLEDLW